MIYDEHIARASRFIGDSSMLQQTGSDMLAAESVWGAAIQAMAAVEHTRSRDSRRHPQEKRFIINLSQRNNLTPELGYGFDIVRDRLHNHFYTGRLNTNEFEEYMETGKVFVRQLLHIAERNSNLG